MEPSELGKKYDKIAKWWHDHHEQSTYGVKQLETALQFVDKKSKALDVGCGSGGRLIHILEKQNFSVLGVDVSQAMLELAKMQHPKQKFIQQDICTWNTQDKFDFILAWDSLFHLPLQQQESVITKLCTLLEPDGVLLYTVGDAKGEHTDQWHNEAFYYSSIGLNENIKLLIKNGLTLVHLEFDQFPEPHVYIVARKSVKS